MTSHFCIELGTLYAKGFEKEALKIFQQSIDRYPRSGNKLVETIACRHFRNVGFFGEICRKSILNGVNSKQQLLKNL